MKKLLLALFILLAIFSDNHSYALSKYSIVDLGDMGGEKAHASAINNHGVVVGTINPYNIHYQGSGAFKWENGVAEILPFLGWNPEAGATSINDNNEVGGFTPEENWPHAVIWDDENTIDDSVIAGWTRDINENSQAVIEEYFNEVSYLWDNGDLTPIVSEPLTGYEYSRPAAINNLGQVVGYAYDMDAGYGFAYLWENDGLTDHLYDLNALVPDGYGFKLDEALDINDNSQIVGTSRLLEDGTIVSYSWLFEDGIVSDLGFSGATAINETGQIVGSNYLYENDYLYNLYELIETEISYTNLKAYDINDSGQIVGSFDVDEETHAFLMNPIPLPATYPTPRHNATARSINANLGWSNGGGATSYDVYFGTDPTLGNDEFKGRQTSIAYEPGMLEYSTTYYWRIDSNNSYGTSTGDLWRFTTEASVTVYFFTGSNGSITGDLNQIVGYGGSTTEVTAIPDAEYQFTNWTGDYEGDDNPLTITNVTSDMNVTANYVLSYDGNNDGMPDALQDHVKNLTTGNNQSITLEFSEATDITSYGSVDNPSPDDTPADIDFPFGFLHFTIDNVEISGATIVTIYLPEGTVLDTYYKYGSTLDHITPHWYEFLYNGTTGAEINGNIITLHFVDGDRGDDDLITNGIIVDDGGFGILLSPPPESSDDDGDGFSENQGDCDDGDIDIYPGADEICGDNIDQDCNGSDLVCPADDGDDDDDDDITPDSAEGNVDSIQTDESDESIILVSPPGTTLSNCQAVDNPSPSDAPAESAFPYGLFSFTIDGVVSGGSTTMTIILPAGANPTSYYKYGPTPDDPSNHWYEFMYDGETGAVINDNIITLHFIDGKRGDSDLDANGTIVDPGGPIIIDALNIPDAASGDGGGGGCFIGSLTR